MNNEKSLTDASKILTNAIKNLMESEEEKTLNAVSELVKAVSILNSMSTTESHVNITTKGGKVPPFYGLKVTKESCTMTAIGGLLDLMALISSGVSDTIKKLQDGTPESLKKQIPELIIRAIRLAMEKEGAKYDC